MNQHPSKDTLLSVNQQVQSALVRILKDHLPLDLQARRLDEDTLWRILLYASVRCQSIESACRSLTIAPSGNRVREHLNEQFTVERMSVEELESGINKALQASLPKQVKRELAGRSWEVAGDWVEIAYYGQLTDGEPFVRRSAARAGTTKFYAYASLTIIDKRHRYTLALTLVRAGEKVVEVVKRLLAEVARLGLKIKLSLWDKAFGVIEVLRYLQKWKIPYIIALAQRGGTGGIKQYCTGRKSGCYRHRFRSSKAGTVSSEIVVVCKYSKKKYRQPGVRYFCYAVYRIGRWKPVRVFEKYRRRFIIESSYRQMHQTRARTATRNALLRMVLIAMALLIVNLYVLLRRIMVRKSEYGTRQRQMAVTLEMVVEGLEEHIRKKLGFQKQLYCRDISLFQSFVNY